MPARSKTRKKAKGGGPREAIREALQRLERDLPPNLARLVRPLRRSLQDLERQIEKARAEGERLWKQREVRYRRDLVGLMRRLEKAVEPKKGGRQSTARRKPAPARKPVVRASAPRPKPVPRPPAPVPAPGGSSGPQGGSFGSGGGGNGAL